MAKKNVSPQTVFKKPHALGPLFQLPPGDDIDLHPQRLLLDPGNLRLLDTDHSEISDTPAKLIGQKAIQDKITEIISSEPSYKISELAKSILTNGFLRHEKIIIASFDRMNYIVLEGNRRITAIRQIYQKYGKDLNGINIEIRETLIAVPCFCIKGEAIDNDERQLEWYRRAAASYVGTRHLMEFVSWEPASRYEFQARLIKEDGWSLDQVADRFGRKRNEIIRDLKAQSLYHAFRQFESDSGAKHKLVYNAFAEAARALPLMQWLGWDDQKFEVRDTEKAEAFFSYLFARVKNLTDDEDQDNLRGTAKEAVKWFKEMISTRDPEIITHLTNKEFESAERLHNERKAGSVEKRLSEHAKEIKQLTVDDLSHNSANVKASLEQLQEAVSSAIQIVDTILHSQRSHGSRSKHNR